MVKEVGKSRDYWECASFLYHRLSNGCTINPVMDGVIPIFITLFIFMK